ncbi:MAG: circularly permuted type 2 ATP-grasp protein [Natronospirillum sp.]|uniref:circularly permuted type 2 ATP-grasp protein n=1 Tax=Natronospirillum sp. TaxID=2812955 RepID=UPI0025FB785B|nr:circularly permuted type 2 ATP-grasp protein [Natronospirillum sp.]MCH8552978.1 circularly permuted type 2 ATP-grasp protein [Natronospirillum sp.]
MPNPANQSDLLQQLLSSYLAARGPLAEGYDELVNAEGHFRARWQPLLTEFEAQALDGLASRASEAQALLHENGVTFNVYEDDVGKLRSWRLDPIPYVISPQSWELLEKGLKQRVRLLELLVDDLYGERQVIKQGILPPELVYSHPSWLFPAADTTQFGDRPRVIFQGIDVIRDQFGAWRVQNDWTQAPSGAGYALENRIILSRALSQLYRDAPLRRLAGFLQAQHRCLAALAPQRRDNPNIVLLTPGPGSSGYFEHAWLANYMNFSLVEGTDLVVRDGQVSMRTLGGLKAVDVIVRQITDPWCDPLELRGDSLLGVPGLMQAARRGEVAIANSLGTGVLEHPALAAFLPRLSWFLLKEPLQLAGRDVLWCGDPDSLSRVVQNLTPWQLREIGEPSRTIKPAELSAEDAAALTAAMEAAPHLYVAEQPLKPATAPSFDAVQHAIAPEPVNLRFFALADPAEQGGPITDRRHRIMPGGLAWVAPPGTPVMESAVVKDIWVLAPVAQPHVPQLRRAKGAVLVTRDGTDLPSRVAESLFWTGRYGERLDNRARLLREALHSLVEEGQQPLEETLLPDLFAALKLELPGIVPVAPGEHPSREVVNQRAGEQFKALRQQLMSLFGEPRADGLPWMFSLMLKNGRAVRDHLGDDAWRTLNTLRQTFNDLPQIQGASSGQRSLEDIVTLLAAFFGLCNETMPHHYGWRFMDIGRVIDRLMANLELLKLALVTAQLPGPRLWEAALATTDNLTVYRRRYRSQLYPAAMLDLLLFDESNPRSVGYMLKRLGTQIEQLPRADDSPFRSQETRLVIQATSHLHLVDIATLTDLESSAAARKALGKLLDQILIPLSGLSEAISHSHFSHAETPQQLVNQQGSF